MNPSGDPPDRDVRDAVRAELNRSAFIEAGAGTGKSTALVSRILAMVEDACESVPLRNIAAITFTERAAGELRDKVRDALLARAADDGAPDRLHQALLDVDVAAIGTIHSFALTILREQVVAAGLPLGFEVASRSSTAEAQSRRMVEFWSEKLPEVDRRHLDAAGISLFQLRKLAEELDRARPRIEQSDVSPPALIDVENRAHEVASGLGALITETLDGCADRDDKLAKHIAGPLSGLRDALAAVHDAASALELRSHWKQGWATAFKTGHVGTQNAWAGLGGAKAVRDRIRGWEQPVRSVLDVPLENALRRAAALAWDELERQQNERVRAGQIDFDDLLLLCLSLLRTNPSVRQVVSRRYRVVLVDEFQDTDPVQWEIIRLVTSDPSDDDAVPQPGRLVVVGDPKQAIYSFRGADIGTYLAVREDFPGKRYELTTSFRSVAPLVAWVNDVFDQLFVASKIQPRYLELLPHHAPSSTEPAGPPVVVLCDPAPGSGDAGDGTQGHAPPNSRDLEPVLVASTIRRAVDDAWLITEPTPDNAERCYRRACTYRDIAVLVPSRTGVDDLLSAFDRQDIPYRSADAQIVLARPAVSGLLAALGVLDDPAHQLDLWWTLKSPLFGCADDELLRYQQAGGRWRIARREHDDPDGEVERALDVLARLRDRWVAPQPTGVVDALIADTGLFETLALVPRGTFDSDCVRMLREHARSWQADGGVGLRDYLTAVNELTDHTSRAVLSEPDDRDDEAVHVSTIHGAKGLEFPVVVVAGMATRRLNFSDVVGVRSDGGIEIYAAGVKTAGYAEWEEQERNPREDAELLRLLYVACTRARDHLVVSVLGGDRTRSATIRDPVLAVDAERVDTPAAAAPAAASLPAHVVDPLPDGWHQQLDRVRAASAVSWVSSPSRAGAALDAGQSGATEDVSERPESETDIESADVLVRRARDGRPVGRALHAALDRLFSAGRPPSQSEADRASRRAVDDEGIPHSYDDVRRRVEAALGSDVAAEAFAAQRRWTELYLAAPQDDDGIQLVEGYADLVFETAAGLVLVDHKSDAILSADSCAHYRAQLDGYADLLLRATGRPVVRMVLLHLPGDTAAVVDLTGAGAP